MYKDGAKVFGTARGSDEGSSNEHLYAWYSEKDEAIGTRISQVYKLEISGTKRYKILGLR